jgi:branched-chain amino acid transport system substrate-binding protein
MMKTSLRKLAPLALFLLLLPACASMAPFGPAASPPAVQKTDEALFREAEASYQRQAYQKAYQQYADYLNRFPQGPHATEARLKEAEVLGLNGDWTGSLRLYQALLARQPEPELAVKARYGIGRAYFKLGEYQQATQVLDNLTASDLPRSLWFSTQALLTEIALKQGRVDQAFSRLRLASQDLASGDREWFNDLKSRLLEQAQPQDLENLVSLYPESPLTPALMLRLTRLAQQGGRTEEARKWANALKERFPNAKEAAAAERLVGGVKVQVGALLPLSGQISNLGFRVQRGMELAARQTPLQLSFRDTHGDPDQAAQTARELAQDQNLVAIVGPLSSGVAQAAADAAQAGGVPLVGLTQKQDFTATGSLVFQAFLTPRQQVHTLVARTLAMGINRYAILYPDSPYGRAFFEDFQQELASRGMAAPVAELYASGTRDFAPAVTALKESFKPEPEGAPGASALFIPDDAATVAAIAGQLAGTPLAGVQLLGTNLLHNARLLENQMAAMNGILFPDAFFVGDPDPAVQKFVAAYRQKYGESPDYLAAQGYVVVRLLAQLAETEKSLSRSTLPLLLLSLRQVPGLPWFRGFNANREEEQAMYLLTIKDGAIRMASPGVEAGPPQ